MITYQIYQNRFAGVAYSNVKDAFVCDQYQMYPMTKCQLKKAKDIMKDFKNKKFSKSMDRKKAMVMAYMQARKKKCTCKK